MKNIINMMYSRDASQKVMAARKVLTEQGKFIGSFAPYGYDLYPHHSRILFAGLREEKKNAAVGTGE